MRKLVCSCLVSVFFASTVAVNAGDPPAKVRQICDPTLPENADVCVPDTFEVIFSTDPTSTDAVFMYPAGQVPADPIDVTIVTKTTQPLVQGWSYGVIHDKGLITVLEATIGGTAAEGALIGGFDATSIDVERCDDAKCATRTTGGGFLSAVVLHFKKKVELPNPDVRNAICKVKYKVEKDVGEDGTLLQISNLIAAKSSPPSTINVTIDGKSKIWTNATDGWIKAEGPDGETNCDNGVDDDGDQKTDCCDVDCATVAPCAAVETGTALCTDGKDNDCDGKTDAADDGCAPPGDCETDPPPRVRQICDPAALPDVCVPDTFEVIFGTDKASTDAVYQYTTVPVDPIDVTIVTYTTQPLVQGWSYGVIHDKSLLTVLEATIGGTEAEGALIGGFDATTIDVERCDTQACANRTKGGGFLSAVVLHFKKKVELPNPNVRNAICKVKYKIEKDVGEAGTYLEISNLLAAVSSPPTDVNITINGASKRWTNATDGWVKLCVPPGPVETDCDDGQDNDGDQETDCDDDDCKGIPPCVTPPDKFKRGDANDDGKVNIADPIWLINELVRKGPATKCQDAADANDDGKMDLSDAMYLIDWRFRGQAAPPAPGPFTCGDDVAADTLKCDEGSTANCP